MNKAFGEIKPRNKHSSSVMTIIMGHAGVGKTTLAVTAQGLGFTALVNFENRISHIDESENLRIVPTSKGEFREDKICDFQKFSSFVKNIESGTIKVDYVIIDTIDSMFEMFLDYYKPNCADKRAAYMKAYDDMFTSFKLLKEGGCNIICTSHVANDDYIEKISLSLNDKLRNKINGLTDNIFYLEDKDTDRILTLKTNSKVKCKLTTKSKEKYNEVVPELINPSWKDIEEAIQ